jgi:integrase
MMKAERSEKLNEGVVEALKEPKSGNHVYYFPEAVIQGSKVPRGFGVRVTSAGARSFVLNYRCAHVERRYTIGQWPDWSVLNAVREARSLRKQVDRGEDPIAARRKNEAQSTGKDTVKAICEEYLKREGDRLRTAEQRRRTLERLVYPELGARQIEAIKRSEIIRLLDKVEDENGARMADDVLAVLRKIMNWHASRSDEFRSPIVRGMARTKPKERARTRTLSDPELRLVWEQAGSAGPFGTMLRFILLTSARLSEARKMPWDELDNAGDWTLPAIRNKTKVDLVRPLSGTAKHVLADALTQQIDGCKLVFSLDGKHPIGGISKFKRRLDAAILAELRKQDPKAKPLPNWTPHDLRRTARSLMSRAGVSSDHAERVLGHVIAGVRATYDRHEYYAEKQDALEKLAAVVARILDPAPANVVPMRKTEALAR